MTMLTILPADTFVTAAFAELLTDVTSLLESTKTQKPYDKDEAAFWRRQLNALNKAESHYLAGVRPQLASASYFIASASRPGALIHRLTYVGSIVVCSCEAGQKQQLCWHHMLVNVLERAAELEALAAKAATISGSGPDSESGPNPIPHAAAAAAWLAGQQQLRTRLSATDAYLAALRDAAPRADAPRRLGMRLVAARKKSAYFTSAFYLNAA